MDILDKYGNVLLHVEAETLRGANLRGANLYGANLRGAKYNENTAFFALACPEEGAFIGWKKVDNLLVKLLIPEDAQRSSATTRKCRASKAVVLEITGATGAPTLIVNHKYGHDTVYEVGKEVLPDSWDDNRWNECSHGIHFFITKQEAINY